MTTGPLDTIIRSIAIYRDSAEFLFDILVDLQENPSGREEQEFARMLGFVQGHILRSAHKDELSYAQDVIDYLIDQKIDIPNVLSAANWLYDLADTLD